MRRHDEANPDDLEMSLPFHTLVAASLQRRGKVASCVLKNVQSSADLPCQLLQPLL